MHKTEEQLIEEIERITVLDNLRAARDGALLAHQVSIRKARRLEFWLLLFTTTTTGAFWILCAEAGPPWLSDVAKWAGALISTACTFLIGYKQKVADPRSFYDEITEHLRTFDNLIFRAEDGQSLSKVKERYRETITELRRLQAELGIDLSASTSTSLEVTIADVKRRDRLRLGEETLERKISELESLEDEGLESHSSDS